MKITATPELNVVWQTLLILSALLNQIQNFNSDLLLLPYLR